MFIVQSWQDYDQTTQCVDLRINRRFFLPSYRDRQPTYSRDYIQPIAEVLAMLEHGSCASWKDYCHLANLLLFSCGQSTPSWIKDLEHANSQVYQAWANWQMTKAMYESNS